MKKNSIKIRCWNLIITIIGILFLNNSYAQLGNNSDMCNAIVDQGVTYEPGNEPVISGLTSSVWKTSQGFYALGRYIGPDGANIKTENVKGMYITPANGYNYSGKPLLVAISGVGDYYHLEDTNNPDRFLQDQVFLLTTDNKLYAWGEGTRASVVTYNSRFHELKEGLPAGVTSKDIKFMRAAPGVLALVTKSGSMYFIGPRSGAFADGGAANTWKKRVIPNITGIKFFELSATAAFVSTTDEKLFTWGSAVHLADGTRSVTQREPKQILVPGNGGRISMIAVSSTLKGTTMEHMTGVRDQFVNADSSSYYVIVDQKVYALGANNFGQLAQGEESHRYYYPKFNWVPIKNKGGKEFDKKVKFITVPGNINLGEAVMIIDVDDNLYSFGNGSDNKYFRRIGFPENSMSTRDYVYPLTSYSSGGSDKTLKADFAVIGGSHSFVILKDTKKDFVFMGWSRNYVMGIKDDKPGFDGNGYGWYYNPTFMVNNNFNNYCTIAPPGGGGNVGGVEFKATKHGDIQQGSQNGTVEVGSIIAYSFFVEGWGIQDTDKITVTDDLLPDSPPFIDKVDGVSRFIETYEVKQEDLDRGYIINTANVEVTRAIGGYDMPVYRNPTLPRVPLKPTDDYYQIQQNNPEATVTVLKADPSLLLPKIEFFKRGEYDNATMHGANKVGENITYTFTVKNVGTKDTGPISIVDDKLSLNPICDFSNIGVNSTETCTVDYKITASDISEKAVYNQASATDGNGNKIAESMDPNPLDPSSPYYDPNCSTCTVVVLEKDPSLLLPQIEFLKKGQYDNVNKPGPNKVGENITYTFTVKNVGSDDTGVIRIVDTKFGSNPICNFSNIVVNATETCTVNYKITATDISAKVVYNQASTTDGNSAKIVDSKDPNPLDPSSPYYDPNCPTCTVVVLEKDPKLQGKYGIIITNSHINQKVN